MRASSQQVIRPYYKSNRKPVRTEKHRVGHEWEGMGCKTPQSLDPAQKSAWMLSGATQGICTRCLYSMFTGNMCQVFV